ncbi:MAG: c-type cytochrome biogenesis protein CcmI [Sulfitobacter sp.]|nr:c-type cytochrome biogenesis protein CcmI [Sulfitobacter sp.]
MTFWIIIFAVAAAVALLLSLALVRGAGATLREAAEFDMQVYRDQLAEVERDVARGVVPPEDAERIRTEISRRILAADAANRDGRSQNRGPRGVLIGIIGLVLVGGSLLLYREVGAPGYGDMALQDRIAFAEEMRESRPSQKEAVAGVPPLPLPEGTSEEFLALVDRLRETVEARPDDLQGHILLTQNEARIGRFSAAAEAQARVVELKGEDLAANDVTDYAELLILAAGGYVSPEAETALRAALAMDETDGRARYYIGLMMVQTGRPDLSFRIWDGLLRRGPEDAAWIAPIRAQIKEVAELAGVNYTLPEIGSGVGRGPSVADIEAVAEMSAEARMKMIGGMVEGLSNRLATEGGPPRDWGRLITSLAILGQPDRARAIYDNAIEVFADNEGALDIIREAGSRAGVAE